MENNSQEKLNLVNSLLNNNKLQEAQDLFYKIKPTDESVEYFLLKGKIDEKTQNWGNAINAYNKVLEIDNDNLDAKNHLLYINNILNFFNTDLLNP